MVWLYSVSWIGSVPHESAVFHTKDGMMVSLALAGGIRESEIFEAARVARNRMSSRNKAIASMLMVFSVALLTTRHDRIRVEELCDVPCHRHDRHGSGRSWPRTLQVQRFNHSYQWVIAHSPSLRQLLRWSPVVRWCLVGWSLFADLLLRNCRRGRNLAATEPHN